MTTKRFPSIAPAPGDAPLPPANPPPTVNAPPPPETWRPSRWLGARNGLRPARSQADAAPLAVQELRGTPSWTEDFGANAPDPNALASDLENASAWRDSWEAATAWLEYCSEQRRLWEDRAYGNLEAVKPVFEYASAHDATVSRRYSGLTRILTARSQSAQRGAKARLAARQKAAVTVPELPVKPQSS